MSIPSDDLNVLALSLDILLRWPLLVSPEFPRGRLQPYVFAGPAAFASYLGGFDVDVSPGLKAGAGLAWLLAKSIALFAEYQFTRFTPEAESNGVRLKMDAETHHVVGGLSFRFQSGSVASDGWSRGSSQGAGAYPTRALHNPL